MNKSEAIRAAIKANAYEAVPYILAYPGGKVSFDDAGSAHEAFVQKAVFGILPEGITPASFKGQVAKARDIALTDLKMTSADLILISEGFLDKHAVCVSRGTAEDGRILGMSVRSAKSLYLGAYFMIMDLPEGGMPTKEAPELNESVKNALFDIMKKMVEKEEAEGKESKLKKLKTLLEVYNAFDKGGYYF